MRTLGEILKRCIDDAPVQLLHECMVGAQLVKAKPKLGTPAHTRVTFATVNMTPNDLMWFSGDLGRPNTRKPQYVGIIVWVRTQDYESPPSFDAVDPSAASTGTPSTRDRESTTSDIPIPVKGEQ